MNQVEQLVFPGKVFRGLNALADLGAVCKLHGVNAFVFGGETALAKTETEIKHSLQAAGVTVAAVARYGGESSRRNIDRLCQQARQLTADVLIAVGGGKALDTGKLVAAECKLPLITVPTIAATCAAITPVSVVYSDAGEFEAMVPFDHCPVATVIDTAVILDSPVRWLAAGLGDTLAKWYEYRTSIKCAPQTGMTLGALANGKLCYDLIAQFGAQARTALETKTFSPAVDVSVDAIILYAGIASILGGEAIRSAAAHGFYNGLTKIPAAHAAGHGFVVGYGNLFLLALEERSDEEILAAMQLADDCAVPITLTDIVILSPTEMQLVAEAILLTPDMKNMPFTATTDMVLAAVSRVEQLAAQFKK